MLSEPEPRPGWLHLEAGHQPQDLRLASYGLCGGVRDASNPLDELDFVLPKTVLLRRKAWESITVDIPRCQGTGAGAWEGHPLCSQALLVFCWWANQITSLTLGDVMD